jgi:hypothetical protein
MRLLKSSARNSSALKSPALLVAIFISRKSIQQILRYLQPGIINREERLHSHNQSGKDCYKSTKMLQPVWQRTRRSAISHTGTSNEIEQFTFLNYAFLPTLRSIKSIPNNISKTMIPNGA